MKAVGVIVEYNPFHNGHAYHLQKAREKSQADIIVAVMSGNFMQRGEPAFVSKWCRTEMALRGGCDLIFELPYRFATQNAQNFANGAVSMLDAIGCQALCFGSEDGDIDRFKRTFAFLSTHKNNYDRNVKQAIKKGVSYAKALHTAFQALSPNQSYIDLSQPNNILGYHYVKAVKSQQLNLELLTIPRKLAQYHDPSFASKQYASASSIRRTLFSAAGKLQDIKHVVPPSTYTLLGNYLHTYGQFQKWDHYWPFLQYRLLHISQQELQNIYEVEEGIENRIIAMAKEADHFQHFMELLKTKRYTWTRLQRICTHILTNSTKADMMMKKEKATYLRLLGMTNKGKQYLQQIKKKTSVPIIAKVSAYKEKDMEADLRAARIYATGLQKQCQIPFLKKEFSQPPIIID
ncbi:nucleotidyltransferase [Bacillaceae bacterium Marseille-Q3522]|nr:nucleotidyltransferase [Bacillaceae bacterium Marseille-Q3522]